MCEPEKGVCVCFSVLCVCLWPFLHVLSPMVRTAIRQRGQFILGVKKARLSINQSSTNFYTSLKPQRVEKEIKMTKFTQIKRCHSVPDKESDMSFGKCGGSRVVLLLALLKTAQRTKTLITSFESYPD